MLRCLPCAYQWQWDPGTEGMEGEVTEMDFRCAKTGGRFKAVFARRSSEAKFWITGLEPIPSEPDARVPKRKLWKTGGTRQVAPVSLHQAVEPVSRVQKGQQPYEAAQFDMSGWKCCGCGHDGRAISSLFVQCGECGELVCGHNVIHIAGAELTFQCHPACGAFGTLAGSIDRFKTTAAEQRPGATKGQESLAGPSRPVALR